MYDTQAINIFLDLSILEERRESGMETELSRSIRALI